MLSTSTYERSNGSSHMSIKHDAANDIEATPSDFFKESDVCGVGPEMGSSLTEGKLHDSGLDEHMRFAREGPIHHSPYWQPESMAMPARERGKRQYKPRTHTVLPCCDSRERPPLQGSVPCTLHAAGSQTWQAKYCAGCLMEYPN